MNNRFDSDVTCLECIKEFIRNFTRNESTKFRKKKII